jgi:hypothetical protein
MIESEKNRELMERLEDHLTPSTIRPYLLGMIRLNPELDIERAAEVFRISKNDVYREICGLVGDNLLEGELNKEKTIFKIRSKTEKPVENSLMLPTKKKHWWARRTKIEEHNTRLQKELKKIFPAKASN